MFAVFSFFLPVSGWASIECTSLFPTKISVLTEKTRIQYDFSQTKAQLSKIETDTISPYGTNHKTISSGLMSGALEIRSEVSFMQETFSSMGIGCLYVKSVDITLRTEPKIFVANEYKPGTCMHNAILEHEQKHVLEDQYIANKYISIIREAIYDVVSVQKSNVGPYSRLNMLKAQTNIQGEISKTISKYSKIMNKERRTRQQSIDTYEEYETIGKACSRSNLKMLK